ncbi:MAG: carbohydrate ABC transporter permease [Candidatus Sumerlaeia bacterium]|nr:carbohydrate ABC transporter permease [Candidatus Sumerlaeia bacterium]
MSDVLAAPEPDPLGQIAGPRSLRRRRALNRALVYLALSLFGVFMAFPFYWMVSSSLKSKTEALQFPPTWVPALERPADWAVRPLTGRIAGTVSQILSVRYWTEQLQWSNYPRAWHLQTRPNTPPARHNFTRYFFNSTVVSLTATAGALLTSVLAAYALATMSFWGAGLYFFFILGTLYIPGQILLIPNYMTFSYLGTNVSPYLGLNSYFCLIVPWLASVFSIFLLRQAFLTLPRDLFDAARIDGAGRMRYLFVVVLPLSKPTLITAFIFNFLGEWNSLLWPLIMAPEPRYRTIMVGLSRFRSEAGDSFDLLMAASAFSILPIVILFFCLQRFFIAGIARTGLK